MKGGEFNSIKPGISEPRGEAEVLAIARLRTKQHSVGRPSSDRLLWRGHSSTATRVAHAPAEPPRPPGEAARSCVSPQLPPERLHAALEKSPPVFPGCQARMATLLRTPGTSLIKCVGKERPMPKQDTGHPGKDTYPCPGLAVDRSVACASLYRLAFRFCNGCDCDHATWDEKGGGERRVKGTGREQNGARGHRAEGGAESGPGLLAGSGGGHARPAVGTPDGPPPPRAKTKHAWALAPFEGARGALRGCSSPSKHSPFSRIQSDQIEYCESTHKRPAAGG